MDKHRTKVPLIRFHGRLFILLGDMKRGGPIATIRQYRNGLCSFAHLSRSGDVEQFHQKIGTRKDIRVVGHIWHHELHGKINPEAFEAIFTDPSWLEPP